MQLQIICSKTRWQQAHIQELLDRFYQHLLELSHYCLTTEDSGLTAADFSEAGIDEDDFQGILDELDDDE